MYLEPHAVVVQVDSSEPTLIWLTGKQAYLNRQHFTEWFGLNQQKIVFQVGFVGHDFGGKGTLMDIPLCYYLAKVTGRAAKMVLRYCEELSAPILDMRRSSRLRLELKDMSAYIPRHEALYIKDDDGPGPFQKKPIGEHGAIPTAAAIANAVYDATGAQIRDLPITAEKVYSVMLQKRMSNL